VIWEPEHLITLDDTSAERQHAGTDRDPEAAYIKGFFAVLAAIFILILILIGGKL
jgi:hypothetical protein